MGADFGFGVAHCINGTLRMYSLQMFCISLVLSAGRCWSRQKGRIAIVQSSLWPDGSRQGSQKEFVESQEWTGSRILPMKCLHIQPACLMQPCHSALRTLSHHRSQAQNPPPKTLGYDSSVVVGRTAAQFSVNGLELSRTTCTPYVGFALIIRKIEDRSSFVVARCRVPTARFDLSPS